MEQKIGFIGAGKVGQTLGHYFISKGIEVSGYYSLSEGDTAIAADFTGTKSYRYLETLLEENGIVFITVSDDAIDTVAGQCAEIIKDHLQDSHYKETLFVHTSGVHTSELLTAHELEGYSLHPLESFPQAMRRETLNLMSLEGHSDKDELFEALLEVADIEFFRIKAHQKAQYHAAAAIASNYLVTTLAYATEQLEAIGLTPDMAMQALFPLIQGTVDNIRRLGLEKALTGPIKRGDLKTVEKHLGHLTDATLYRALGVKTVLLADLPEDKRQAMLQRLEEE